MKVYGVAFSPFVQKVLLAARLKGHELALDMAPGMSLQSPEFARISPMRRIPVLVDGDLPICESAAIIAHLDEVLDGPALLPADAAGRARARAIAAIADGEFAAAMRPFVVQKLFHGPANPALLTAAEDQAARGLDAIERLLDAGGPWAAGPAATVADATLIPYLVLAEILERVPGVPRFIADRPALMRYRDAVLAQPVPARTRDEMATAFTAMLAARQQQAAQQQ